MHLFGRKIFLKEFVVLMKHILYLTLPFCTYCVHETHPFSKSHGFHETHCMPDTHFQEVYGFRTKEFVALLPTFLFLLIIECEQQGHKLTLCTIYKFIIF
jgi:hypothetical protein